MVEKLKSLVRRDGPKNVNRRRFIKAMGAVCGATTVFGGQVAAVKKTVEEQGIEVSTLRGKDAKAAISVAQKNSAYKKIASEFREVGLTPKPQHAICKLTIDDEHENHRTVVMPFKNRKKGGEIERAHILWTGRNFGQYQTIGFQFHQSDEKVDVGSKGIPSRSVRFVVDSGELKSTESNYHTLGGEIGANDYIPVGGSNCGPDYCEADATVCDSYNYDCWSSVAGAYGSAIYACSACVTSWFDDAICGLCVATVLTAYGVDCDLGNGCKEVTGCYECSEYPSVT